MPYQTINPFNNKLIKEYQTHNDRHVEQALETAHQLYKSDWAQGDIKQRLNVLHKLSDIISSRVEELAKGISIEMGKLIEQSRAEVQLTADIAKYYAENAEEFLKPVSYKSNLGEACRAQPYRGYHGRGAVELPVLPAYPRSSAQSGIR